jgi:hypothetical protein
VYEARLLLRRPRRPWRRAGGGGERGTERLPAPHQPHGVERGPTAAPGPAKDNTLYIEWGTTSLAEESAPNILTSASTLHMKRSRTATCV